MRKQAFYTYKYSQLTSRNKETFNAEVQSTQRTAEKEEKVISPLVLLCVLCA